MLCAFWPSCKLLEWARSLEGIPKYHEYEQDPPMDAPNLKPQVPAVSLADAFILYRQQPEKASDQCSCNPEAYRILLLQELPPCKGMASPPHLQTLCARWKQLLDKRMPAEIRSDREIGGPASCYLDLYQSWRRRYIVRGSVLSDDPSPGSGDPANGDCHYLFVLERAWSELPQLNAMFRKWQLNRREQEVVRLLLQDKTNQEIADTLNLSVHTVKTYLKMLMRKLGVASRAGVISSLFTGFIS
jgi:DNA-binding CsgD family transcriptional regulator